MKRYNEKPLTYGDRTMSATAWSKMSGVNVHRATILRRKALGMSDKQALFAPKGTHNSQENKNAERN